MLTMTVTPVVIDIHCGSYKTLQVLIYEARFFGGHE